MNSSDAAGQPPGRVPDMERIRNARRKRQQQLKRWQQYDKSMEKDLQKKNKKGLTPQLALGKRLVIGEVKFPQSVVLLEAAARDDLDEVRRLLSEGVCPNVTNTDGLTALHQCCIDDNHEMCRLLIRFGADVNARDTELWTPLHAAATCCHTILCKLLIDSGADLLAVNADGNMPYDICEDDTTLDLIESEMANRDITQDDIDEHRRLPEREMLEAVENLVKRGSNLNQLDDQGAAPLHIAAACGYIDVACFLLQHGAILDFPDRDGWLALHIAACWGQFDVIEMLTNFGANLESTTSSGETVFDICEDEKMHDRLLLLMEELKRRQTQNTDQQQNWANKNKGLVRRRSSNPRSASIRRTSMRDKAKISWKEARLEADTCSLVVSTDDGTSVEETKAPLWMTSSVEQSPKNKSKIDQAPSLSSVVRISSPKIPSSNAILDSHSSCIPQPSANIDSQKMAPSRSPAFMTTSVEHNLPIPASRSRSPIISTDSDLLIRQKGDLEQLFPVQVRPTKSNVQKIPAPPRTRTIDGQYGNSGSLPPKRNASIVNADISSRNHPNALAGHSATIPSAFSNNGAPTNRSENSLFLHNAYYSQSASLPSPGQNMVKLKPIPISVVDRRDSRSLERSKSVPPILLSTGTEPAGGVVANPLLATVSGYARAGPPRRKLISDHEYWNENTSGKCCLLM